ncbi:MAG: GNAT family N-acetyltransferase [Butyrivibrio sp.]|nr:GNAT family N-acetyltransferase [Butyrivibrio sp.]
MIETKRLLLREYTMDDFDALYEIMSDSETMQHYPAPFDEARTRRWIEWNLENYAQYGFGLWAVVLKETDEFIGDCARTELLICLKNGFGTFGIDSVNL